MEEISIVTSNSKYENGECVGGYHEIHKANYLAGIEHAIATIDSIIKNNLLYAQSNTVLDDVTISCGDREILDNVEEHYMKHPLKVRIIIERNVF